MGMNASAWRSKKRDLIEMYNIPLYLSPGASVEMQECLERMGGGVPLYEVPARPIPRQNTTK